MIIIRGPICYTCHRDQRRAVMPRIRMLNQQDDIQYMVQRHGTPNEENCIYKEGGGGFRTGWLCYPYDTRI